MQDEKGYLILAVNTDAVDYVACATALAKSIKFWEPAAKICLLSDQQHELSIFDYVKVLPYGNVTKQTKSRWANDWQVFAASPFRQTVKLEADMVVTAPIGHWWTMMEKRDVVIPVGCRNFYGEWSSYRGYRKIFDRNGLPDVYNAVTYWRLSMLAQNFFDQVRQIFENWDIYKRLIKGINTDHEADTDLVYAIAATILGVDQVTLPPVCDYPSFVHLKANHNHCASENCLDQLVWEFDQGSMRINTVTQHYPVHYHNKDFYKHVDEHYDKLLGSR